MAAIGGDNLVVVIANLAGFFEIGVEQLNYYCNENGENTGKKDGKSALAGEYSKYSAEYLGNRAIKGAENTEEA